MPDYDYAKIGIGAGFFAMFAALGAAAWSSRGRGKPRKLTLKWESVAYGRGGNDPTGTILYEGTNMQQAINAAVEYVSLHPRYSAVFRGKDSSGWAVHAYTVWNEDGSGRIYAGWGESPHRGTNYGSSAGEVAAKLGELLAGAEYSKLWGD